MNPEILPTTSASPISAPPNNLTPTLTLSQLQENITAMQKQLGAQNPNVQSYVNQYKNNGDGTYSLNTPTTPSSTPTTSQTNPVVQAGQNLVTDTNAHAANIVGDLSSKPSMTGVLDVAGNVAGEVGDFFGEGLKAVAKTVLPSSAIQGLKSAAQSVAGSPEAQGVLSAWNGFSAQHPEAAKNIGNVVNIAALFGGNEAEPIATEATGNGLETAKNAVGDVVQGIKENAASSAENAKDDFVGKLITPQMTTKDLTSAIKTGKVAEGEGLTGARDVTSAIPGFENIKLAVKEVPGISPKNTLLENVNAIHDEIGNTAEDLKSQLADKKNIFSPNQFKGYMNGVKSELAENPLIVGDAEKTANKILDKFSNLVDEKGYTPSGLLDARKSLDKWMSTQKGDAIFDPAKETAVSIALRGVRQGGNNFLSELAPDVPVKDMLSKQSNLYDAIDNIAPKAAKEGATGLKQWVKAHPNLVKIGKYVAGGTAAGAAAKVGYDAL